MQSSSHFPPILLTPGPVPISQKILQELGREMVHHRSKKIKAAFFQIQSHLQKIFQTKQHVYILHSTGTGAMEAAITNTLSPGDEILTICGGKFGDRWLNLAQTYNLVPHDIQVPWGKSFQVDVIKEKLKKHPKVRAVFLQACETSTATFHPIKEVAELFKNREDILLVVDAMTALILVDLPMDEWGIDILIGGSQKSFALPTGLSFISLSEKAYQFQKKSLLPVFYFDLEKEKKANLKGETAFSSNVTFIRALDMVLEEFFKTGLKTLQKKCQALAQSTHQFCKELNLSLFSSSPGPTLTAICVPENMDGVQIKKTMEDNGVIVGGGQEHLKGRIIRIGHMGDISVEDHIQGLKVFGMALRKQDPSIFSEEQLRKTLDKIKREQF